MTYDESIDYIRETAAFGSKLGLDNIRTLMSLLGNPQERLNIIHIAGTNGKGSVAAYLLSILESSGYKTGLYTSPELYRFSERIRINDDEISNDNVAAYATKVRTKAEYMAEHGLGSPSEFELVLAMAFCYFLDEKVDAVILEVGLGGRLDATNVINKSLLSIITKISFDHMQYLGDTLPQIASEKAAIIKPRGRVIVHPADQEVMEVFQKKCKENQAELFVAELPTKESSSLTKGQTFTLQSRINQQSAPGMGEDNMNPNDICMSNKSYTTCMLGLYEIENAALAIQAAELMASDLPSISDESIHKGIAKAIWPGRFEILQSDPLIIVDGAHNEDGARALSETISEYFKDKKVCLYMGILRDKQYKEMLAHLLKHASSVITCTVPNSRSLKGDELAEVIKDMKPDISVKSIDSPEQAYNRLMNETKKPRQDAAAYIICGSLYLVGPMRELILQAPYAKVEEGSNPVEYTEE